MISWLLITGLIDGAGQGVTPPPPPAEQPNSAGFPTALPSKRKPYDERLDEARRALGLVKPAPVPVLPTVPAAPQEALDPLAISRAEIAVQLAAILAQQVIQAAQERARLEAIQRDEDEAIALLLLSIG